LCRKGYSDGICSGWGLGARRPPRDHDVVTHNEDWAACAASVDPGLTEATFAEGRWKTISRTQNPPSDSTRPRSGTTGPGNATPPWRWLPSRSSPCRGHRAGRAPRPGPARSPRSAPAGRLRHHRADRARGPATVPPAHHVHPQPAAAHRPRPDHPAPELVRLATTPPSPRPLAPLPNPTHSHRMTPRQITIYDWSTRCGQGGKVAEERTLA
jgi:hypothetical protein